MSWLVFTLCVSVQLELARWPHKLIIITSFVSFQSHMAICLLEDIQLKNKDEERQWKETNVIKSLRYRNIYC